MLARLRATLESAMGLCVRARSAVASLYDPKPRRKPDCEKEAAFDHLICDYSIWDDVACCAPPLEENGENVPEKASESLLRQKIAEDARRLRCVIAGDED